MTREQNHAMGLLYEDDVKTNLMKVFSKWMRGQTVSQDNETGDILYNISDVANFCEIVEQEVCFGSKGIED